MAGRINHCRIKQWTRGAVATALAITVGAIAIEPVRAAPLGPGAVPSAPLMPAASRFAVSLLAGSGSGGYFDATGAAARFYGPYDAIPDGTGNLVVSDHLNNAIRRVTPAGIVTTVVSSLDGPTGMAYDASGNLFVAEQPRHRIQRIAPDGAVTTFAGSGTPGFVNGTGTGARFNMPNGLAFDASGNLFVAEYGNHRIRRITPDGVVSTFAGSGSAGGADGTGTAASFNNPRGMVFDAAGNLFVSEWSGHRIRRITPDGVVSTFAGAGTSGAADGTGTSATFNSPLGMAFDARGNLFVADFGNHKVRRITPGGVVTTTAGTGVAGSATGPAPAASFDNPTGVVRDSAGTVYVVEYSGQRIEKIAEAGAGNLAVSWSAPNANGSTIYDYVIQYRPSQAASWTVFDDGVSTATATTITGLIDGVTYDVRVSAVNAVGTGPASVAVTAAPGIAGIEPDAPTGLVLTASGAQLAASWTAPVVTGSSAITDYVVEYRTTPFGAWTTFADGVSNSTSATVTGLSDGVAYDVRVSAVNASGVGNASAIATATPLGSFATVHTGSTMADAAPSCWAIKQSFPASGDGVYWLQTPTLVVPQQFYCDMTTDGGGYVLVARGREGWQFARRGQGLAASVRGTPSGPAAFVPAALSSATIDGLLDGRRVDALRDGVRVRRAANSSGTAWQEVRLGYSNLGAWSWNIPGGIQLAWASFDGVLTRFAYYDRCSWATTCDVTVDSGTRRLWTFKWANHGNRQGFNYGQVVAGQNNATSYLWSKSTEGHASPFAQVFLRPQLSDADVEFSPIRDAGAPATSLRAMPSSSPQVMSWGVTDVAKPSTDPDVKNDSPVLALAQVGSTMFVGGKFQNVQNGRGGPKTSQPWLAAFDVQTGNWISTFRPALDGAVWDLVAAPDGNLIVAGNFSQVNGVAGTAGLAKLDPATGAPVAGWSASVSDPRFQGPRANVRALDIQGRWLYMVGSFNSIVGGPSATQRTVGGIARVALSDGTPDTTWRAFADSTLMDIDASPDGSRVYVVGFFKNVGTTASYGTPANARAVLDTVTGAPIPGMGAVVPTTGNATRHYQQTILEYQGSVFMGGSEHDFQKYTRSDFRLVRGHVTQHGGDFQSIAAKDGIVYGTCHCYQTDFSDTYAWPPTRSYGRVDNSSWVIAFDANTFDQLNEFDPQWTMNTGTGEGPWELTFDSYGCLWAGGDVNGGDYIGTAQSWLAGFARFCPRDSVPPTTPTSLRTVTLAGVPSLQWGASTDDRGAYGMTYEVLRGDRVIGTTRGGRTFALPDTDYGRYAVRATDLAGNRSATTPVLTVGTAPTYAQVIARTPGVLAHWRLGERGAATTALDAVGTNPGAYSGDVQLATPGLISGDADTAAAFTSPAADGVVAVPDSPTVSPTTAFSAELWVDVDASTRDVRTLLAKPGSFSLRLGGGRTASALAFSVITDAGTFSAEAATPIAPGVHHLVATYNGGLLAVYDNDRLEAAAIARGTVVDSDAALTIGNGPDGAADAVLDEVALYGRGLRFDEVMAHRAAGARVVRPNELPTASIRVTCGGLSCGFDGSASNDPDGTIMSYEWAVDDGGVAAGVQATHTFPTAGTYVVRLTVSDDDGATAATTQQVVVAPALPAPFASDDFGRLLTKAWGTADDGSAWTTQGTTSNFAVDGTAGTILAPAAGSSSSARLLDLTEADTDLRARVRFDTAQNGLSWVNAISRALPGGVEYRGRVRVGATSLYAGIYQTASGGQTAVVPEVRIPGLVPTPNTWYRIRTNVRGFSPTTIKMKVWVDGTPEPATWTIAATDSTPALQTAGGSGFQVFTNSSASYPTTWSVDDVVVNPANLPPVASFAVNCNLRVACAVDGSASADGDGSVVAMSWNFGDGTSAVGATATHAFGAPGTYTITLMVTDDGGFSSSTSRTVIVQNPPTAAFTTRCADYVCTFDGSSSSDSDGTVVAYAWDFGNGTTSTAASPTVDFGSVGTRSVSLVVTDDDGATDTVTQPATANKAPTATFGFDCTADDCVFDASASSDSDGAVVSYAWNFGDGSSGAGAVVDHSFPGGGTHTVTLTVTDDLAGRASSSQSVVQSAAPTAAFSVSCAGHHCEVDASGSNDADGTVVAYDWDFGDGTTGTGAQTTADYAVPGVVTITLTVTDDSGRTATTTRVAIPDEMPTAAFGASCALLVCSFDAAASADTDGAVVGYSWFFGDGTTDSSSTPLLDHSFAWAGSYPVRLTVTDDLGATRSTTVTVEVAPAPVVDRHAADGFTRAVANGWGSADLGGAWSRVGPPQSFSVNGAAGLFTLASNGATAAARLTAVSNLDVDVQASTSFDVAQTGSGSWVNLIARSTSPTQEYRGRVRFSGSSVYAAVHRVAGGSPVVLVPEVVVPGITSTPGTVYRVRFSVSGTAPTTLRLKVWANGTPEPVGWNVQATDSTPVLQGPGAVGLHAYAQGAVAYPMTFAFDDVAVRPANFVPTAAFGAACGGSSSCAFDASGSTDDAPIASYHWVFGDGTTATGVAPTKQYVGPGTYTVTLTVVDALGVVHWTRHDIVVT